MAKRQHELTVAKIKEIQLSHEQTIQKLQGLVYEHHVKRLQNALTIAIDEAIGRLGLEHLVARREALVLELQQIDREIAAQTGGIQQVDLNPERLAKTLVNFIWRGDIFQGIPQPLQSEVVQVFEERGWEGLVEKIPESRRRVITVAELREQTKTLAEIKILLEKEQRETLQELQSYLPSGSK